MRKIDPKRLKADWTLIKDRKIHHFVSSAELAQIFGCHIQTISNWCVRQILPKPVAHTKKLKGNRNYYKISAIKAWIQGKPELELYRELLALEFGWTNVQDDEAQHAMNLLYENPYMDIHNG